jgi:hypothetical protein
MNIKRLFTGLVQLLFVVVLATLTVLAPLQAQSKIRWPRWLVDHQRKNLATKNNFSWY